MNTLYFSPGVYDLSEVTSNVTRPGYVNKGIYTLYSNQYVYLAGGAYVKGSFMSSPNSSTDNVVIWQLANSGVFEFGVNSPVDSVDDVQVINSNVIRTEYSWTGSSNAVFTSYLARTQQLGQNIGYLFNEIHVENSSWQLFKLEIGPGLWQGGVTQQQRPVR